MYVPTICDKSTIDIRSLYEQSDHVYVIGTVDRERSSRSVSFYTGPHNYILTSTIVYNCYTVCHWNIFFKV